MFCFFFFNDTATTEIYTLSLHDALPIYARFGQTGPKVGSFDGGYGAGLLARMVGQKKAREIWFLDRKSTRLNSSHANISYAVFCLKKKKKRNIIYATHNTSDYIAQLSLL